MRLHITKSFLFAHRGVEVREYQAGQSVETDDAAMVSVSTAEGWAALEGQQRNAPETSAHDAAPERKTRRKSQG